MRLTLTSIIDYRAYSYRLKLKYYIVSICTTYLEYIITVIFERKREIYSHIDV